MRAMRDEVANAFTQGFANVLGDAESPIIRAIHDACKANLENSIEDPELREQLRPNYRAACKRLIMSGEFYDAIQRPNAALVTSGISRAETSGIRTEDGELHELDVLILATGFQVDQFVRPIKVTGRGGIALDELWKEGPTAYMAISVPEFPNFFMLNGPNSPVGNFSLIEVAELQFDYVMRVIEERRAGSWTDLAPSRVARARCDADGREAAKTTSWNTGCRCGSNNRSSPLLVG